MGTGRKTLVLHIGLGKTGTTVLQHFFSGNHEALRARGIEYPVADLVDHAHHRFSPHVPHYMKERWQFEPVDAWAARISASDARDVLLSSELMSSASADELETYFRVIHTYFRPRIVVYLRRQDHMLMSVYNQQVKSGRQKRPLSAVALRRFEKLDYLNTLKRWERLVGREAMVVRPYEREQLRGGDIRHDFMSSVLCTSLDDTFTLTDANPNPAFPNAVLEYKRCLNWVVKDRPLHQRCNRLLGAYAASRESPHAGGRASVPVLSVNERLAILGALSQSNAEVARRYLGRKDGSLFQEPLPDRVNRGKAQAIETAESAFASDIFQFIQTNDSDLAAILQRLVIEQGEPEGHHHMAAIRALRASFG